MSVEAELCIQVIVMCPECKEPTDLLIDHNDLLNWPNEILMDLCDLLNEHSDLLIEDNDLLI